MKKLVFALALWLPAISALHAQSVQQSGNVSPNHVSIWATNGVIKDGGTASNPFATSFGVVGGSICVNSGPITGAYNALCFAATTSGGGTISIYNYAGATGGLSFIVNGVPQGFPSISLPTTTNDAVCFANTSGQLTDCNPSGVWKGAKIGLVYGGTNADLSATGGTSQVLKQVSSGAAVTVGQLAFSDISGFIALSQGGLGGSQSAATAGQVPIFPGSSGAAVPGNLSGIAGAASVAQLGGSAASHAVPIDVAGTSTWKVVPDCQDSAGNHLNYTQSSDSFSCGTSTPSKTSGFYTLQYISSAWTCTAPDGSTVTTSGTTTSGLQECINAMQSAKTGNFRAICPPNTALSASTTVTFGPAFAYYYDLRGCSFTSTATTGYGVILDTFSQGTFLDWSGGYFHCQLTSTRTACISIAPKSGDPVFGSKVFQQSVVNLPAVNSDGACLTHGLLSVMLLFDPNEAATSAITNNKFFVAGLDGNAVTLCPVTGVEVVNPATSGNAFVQNIITIPLITDFTTQGIAVCSGGGSGSNPCATNEWHVSVTVGTSATYGIDTFGFYDQWYVGSISINSGSLTDGIKFETGSDKNWLIAPQIDATTPKVDGGTSNHGVVNGTTF